MKDTIVALSYDCHSHLHMKGKIFIHYLNKNTNKKIRDAPVLPQKTCICASHEGEYLVIDNICKSFPDRVIPAFGIHPWCSHSIQGDGWIDRLKNWLIKYPESIIGEIGIDKISKTKKGVRTFNGPQKVIFERQVELASEMRRAINVHCVRAHGYLFEYLRSFAETGKFFPKVLLHSFSGNKEMVIAYSNIPNYGSKIWFSFSFAINMQKEAKGLRDSIKIIPENRIVIESDWHCVSFQLDGMVKIIQLISEVKGWTPEETVAITTRNALEFFQPENQQNNEINDINENIDNNEYIEYIENDIIENIEENDIIENIENYEYNENIENNIIEIPQQDEYFEDELMRLSNIKESDDEIPISQ